ncbi:MAG: HpaII family restriction endonuclease [Flavobacteriaceae bacterium]|nr:HpaII family restriction endonuclease [Flavobacteriaceae bacterium]
MSKKITFIDLFAGIGGFHLALHQLGAECVFASEIDNHARKTYQTNFQKRSPFLFENENFNTDIRSVNPHIIPDFDILCAGFPCQPFSQAGLKRGFNDLHNSERGNLFFYIAEILQEKRPKAFFLENVQGLLKHDNGKTFQTIRKILEEELGYSFYYKVVKASDYGLPQHRPRLFMIGFRDEKVLKGFQFPFPIKLKYTLSDIFQGKCDREVGYTLRVGGRGSGIDDRRNWEFYRVDGMVKRISVKEAKKLQGFPDDFEFPVSETQAMKQLGNSVAVDAIYQVAKNVIEYLSFLEKNNNEMKQTKNKGEWTELLVFLKLLIEKKLILADENLEPNNTQFNIHKITNQNLNIEFLLSNESDIVVKNKQSSEEKNIEIFRIINPTFIEKLVQFVKEKSGTFEIPDYEIVQNELGINIVKGGNSTQKSDIVLGIQNNDFYKENEGFGIKSYLGNKPTLLNASGNTNFIFKIKGLDKKYIDEINAINTKEKLKDRLVKIGELGGTLHYERAEKDNMDFNLKMVDSQMPNLIGQILLIFYKDRVSSISEICEILAQNENDKILLENKVKKLLVDILLGFFAGTKWNGTYEANGTIVMKNNGECVAFHIIELENLRNYLFKNIKLDTPSTTRHRFGQVYIEKNEELYFKLNLQLRF